MIDFVAIGLIYAVGICGVLTTRHVIKLVIALNLLEAATVMLIVRIGYVAGGDVPIVTQSRPAVMVDPLPQAMSLTAIVIGAATSAVILCLAIRISHHYGTLDIRKVFRRDPAE